ncbi:MAG: O-antigen ligase domain-containing protein [Proteobacteria bacterium]|nr:MAG: O-antigen ligase domain-containing protein [Pseudomonadota bacterium]
MSQQRHRFAIKVFLAIYIIATWTSVAGMEVFGWTTALLTFSYLLRKPEADRGLLKAVTDFYPWKICLALFLTVVLGLLINGLPTADYRTGIGSQRYMLMLLSLTCALSLWPPTLKGYKVFVSVTALIAVYGIFQSITGIDLRQPGSHKAVQPLMGMHAPWRTAGFFGLPLHYAYIAGQWVCLTLAMSLLTFKNRKSAGWLFWGSLAATVFIGASIITSFTRGAWIAMAVAWLTIAWIAAPRLALGLLGSGLAAGALLFATFETFRVRLMSLFDFQYSSNSERLFLWRANFEMFRDYPILGVGNTENEARAREYVTKLGRPDHFTGHAHNNYIQMLSGTGAIGFTLYMALISYMLWLTWRLWQMLPADKLWLRAIALGALGAQIHIHVGGFTEANFKALPTNHNLMVVWALVLSTTLLYGNRGRVTSDIQAT